MRLSEAIILGDTLAERNPASWCGCASGRAYMANGGTEQIDRYNATPLLMEMWKWLTPPVIADISCKFFDVCAGKITLEELADHVRMMEPDEEKIAEEIFEHKLLPAATE